MSSKRTKMSLADLKALWPVWAPLPVEPGSGPDMTRKGARHEHKPVWLPGTPQIRPALYRHRHMGRAKN